MSKIQTKLINLGRNPRKYGGTVNPPISKTSTITYPDLASCRKADQPYHTDLSYGRSGTTTHHELIEIIMQLDNAHASFLTPSGMSAIALSLLSTLKAGDHLLITDAVYKCTKRFVEEELTKFKIEYSYYIPTSLKHLKEQIKPNTKAIYLESPGSGTMDVQDIAAIVKIAKEQKFVTIFDNSWATPLFLKPLDLGVNICVQSLTKFINGHSDLFMGAISVDKDSFKAVKETLLNFGAVPSAGDCYDVMRGLRTLYVRLEQQMKSAIEIAQWLEKHPKVLKVLHPALPTFEGHANWLKYYSGATSVFYFVLKTKDQKCVENFVNKLKLFGIGLSWGGYESLIIPYNVEKLRHFKEGVLDGTYIRLHVGLENARDLLEDLSQAMDLIE